MILSSPLTMLSGFMMVAIILYAWFSTQFNRKVLQQQQVVGKRLKDLVKVNGIVAIIFSIVVIVDVVMLIGDPQAYINVIKGLGVEMPLKTITSFLYVMLGYGVVLLTHVIWTLLLIRKHSLYFQ